MKHSASVWLPLALPLLLIGCGSEKPPSVSNTANTTTTQAPTTPTETQTPPPSSIELQLKDDPVDQVEAINQTIDVMESVSTPIEIEVEAPAPEPVLETEAETSALEPEPTPVSEETGVEGTYVYDVSYRTPGGTTSMSVAFSLQNNVISAVELNGNPQHSTSLQYQNLLEDELGSLVVGQDLNAVGALPSKVAGSSLTPEAFNDALAQLQAEV